MRQRFLGNLTPHFSCLFCVRPRWVNSSPTASAAPTRNCINMLISPPKIAKNHLRLWGPIDFPEINNIVFYDITVRVTERFFSGVLHPHLLGVCRPSLSMPFRTNRSIAVSRISTLTLQVHWHYFFAPAFAGV